ncbi:MAG: rod shape-determining protein MreD [Oscillospiraceae bacterium]|nr:hypothetical protein [Ruminococcus sp.]MBQ7013761.1 rod shape-determining protein MreD [Oscillospiraceae bacterium]
MIRRSTRQERRRYYFLQTLQWVIFGLLIALAFLTSTAGSMLKPLLLIPLSLCISSHTGEIQAMAVGTISGLLLDISCGKLLGYNAVLLVVCCVAVSLLYNYILRQKLFNILLLTAVCTLVQGYLDYTFYYSIWGHEDVGLIYTGVILPSGAMTVASTLLLYAPIKWLAEKCGNRRTHELEKTMLGAAYRD